MNNIDRHTDNLNLLTGRHDGKYLSGGEPRGGGGRHVIEEARTRYEPTFASEAEVFAVLGINDDGARTPYENLSAQVRPVPEIKRSVFDQNWKLINVFFNHDG